MEEHFLKHDTHKACACEYNKYRCCQSRKILLAVFGAHLSGQPLNFQLTDVNAKFVAQIRTDKHYRMYLIGDPLPTRPALVYDPNFCGAGIYGELWALCPDALGDFMKNLLTGPQIAQPSLAIGPVLLNQPFRYNQVEYASVLGFVTIYNLETIPKFKELTPKWFSWLDFRRDYPPGKPFDFCYTGETCNCRYISRRKIICSCKEISEFL